MQSSAPIHEDLLSARDLVPEPAATAGENTPQAAVASPASECIGMRIELESPILEDDLRQILNADSIFHLDTPPDDAVRIFIPNTLKLVREDGSTTRQLDLFDSPYVSEEEGKVVVGIGGVGPYKAGRWAAKALFNAMTGAKETREESKGPGYPLIRRRESADGVIRCHTAGAVNDDWEVFCSIVVGGSAHRPRMSGLSECEAAPWSAPKP